MLSCDFPGQSLCERKWTYLGVCTQSLTLWALFSKFVSSCPAYSEKSIKIVSWSFPMSIFVWSTVWSSLLMLRTSWRAGRVDVQLYLHLIPGLLDSQTATPLFHPSPEPHRRGGLGRWWGSSRRQRNLGGYTREWGRLGKDWGWGCGFTRWTLGTGEMTRG